MKKASFNSSNVLEAESDSRHLWQFSVSGGQVKLTQEQSAATARALPANVGARDWRSLFQSRLNIAWLPADQVFIRLVQLPAAEMTELASMVEFQLEKLSPIPVNQIVWGIESLGRSAAGQETLAVVIAERGGVEKFLGQLEADKFLADRLDLPHLHQLAATAPSGDSAWIFPAREGQRTLCLVAWWLQGAWQQAQLIQLPHAENAPATLIEQINKTSWAGEIEGWLTGAVRWHLVAEPELAAVWEPVLREWSGASVETRPPLTRTALAELTVKRAALSQSNANLLPPEFAARYHQQFVDRLWMSGLGAVIGAYIVGVLIYFGVLGVLGWQKDRVEKEVKATALSYTNAIRLREKVDVLQEQVDLKFAALDAFEAVSTHLPQDFVLNHFNISRGQKLTLQGHAPPDQAAALTEYAKALREASVNGKPIFSSVPVPTWALRPVPGAGQQMSWGPWSIELRRESD